MLLYEAQTSVAQRCNPNMKPMKLKKVLGGEALFIVMTFIECFRVPYLLIEYALQDIFMIYCIFIIDEQLVKLLYLQ